MTHTKTPSPAVAGTLPAALACIAILVAAPAFAADSAPLPSVQDIVDGNARARGGLDAWHAIHTLIEHGRIDHGRISNNKSRHQVASAGSREMEASLPFTLSFKAPHKMRLEMHLGDATALQIFDGTSGWMMQPSPQGPLVRGYTPGEKAAAAEQVDAEGPLLDAAAKGTVVTLDGEDSVEGHRAYKLRLKLKSGVERHLWVDAATLLDIKIDGTRMFEGKAWPAETYFYDWKQDGRIKLPHRIETAVSDTRTSSRIIVEQVRINAPLADSEFAMPAPPVAAPAPIK